MPKRSDIRKLAMQLLYQIDVRGEDDPATVGKELAQTLPENLQETAPAAFELATATWQNRGDADTLINELAPKWPTHRQPPVDRAILRLAYHEIKSEHAPANVVIDQAVELAKIYASENSPAFINGVLDQMAKRLDVGA